MKRFTVIFVCTGNTCRSPMAEGIMKDLILDEAARGRVIPPVDVMSAGIHAATGQPASRFAVEIAAEHGIGLQFHRARQLTADLVRFADLILTMEWVHTDCILHTWPEAVNVEEVKRYCLEPGALIPRDGIADPVGSGIEAYHETFEELRTEITRISKVLFPCVLEMNNLR